MEAIQYVKNAKGDTTGLFIELSNIGKKSREMVEDIEDIISYELRKNSKKIDFDTFVEKNILSK